MKRNHFRSFMFVALGTMIISCSKEEPPVNDVAETSMTNQVEKEKYPLTIPNSVTYPSESLPTNGTKLILFGEQKPIGRQPHRIVRNTDVDFGKGTCLVDFSKKKFNQAFSYVDNKNVNVGFHNSRNPSVPVVKLKTNLPPPQGWNLPWGTTAGFTEAPKELLFIRGGNEFSIVFSKPVDEVSFEMSANRQNYNAVFDVAFGRIQNDRSNGSATSTNRTPGFASSYGVFSTKSFTTVTIKWIKPEGSDHLPPEGVVITNLRYRLAK